MQKNAGPKRAHDAETVDYPEAQYAMQMHVLQAKRYN